MKIICREGSTIPTQTSEGKSDGIVCVGEDAFHGAVFLVGFVSAAIYIVGMNKAIHLEKKPLAEIKSEIKGGKKYEPPRKHGRRAMICLAIDAVGLVVLLIIMFIVGGNE